MDHYIPVPVFESAARTGSRVLGDNFGVEVVFEGDQAYTDGKRIVIPALDHTKELTGFQVRATRGYWHHEAAHIRYTDMPAYQQAVLAEEKKGNEMFASVLNALEDGRIEHLWLQEYPGGMEGLSAAHEAVDQHALDQMKADPNAGDDYRIIGPMAITWASGNDKGYTPQIRDECIRNLNPAIWKKSQEWYRRSTQCKTTQDVIALAREVTEHMARNPMPPRPGAAGAGAGQAGGAGGAGSGQPGQGQGSGQGQGGDGQGGSNGTGGAMGTRDKKPEPISPDLNVKGVLGDAASPGGSAHHDVHRPFTTEEDRFLTPTAPGAWAKVLTGQQGNDYYAKLTDELVGKVQVMQRKIARGFAASQNRDWVGGNPVGRLDARRLTAAYQGVQNVHKLRAEAPDIDTAAQIIVDGSGSMGGSNIFHAAAAAVALVRVMESIGVVCEVISFPGRGKSLSGKHADRMQKEAERMQQEGKDFHDFFSRTNAAEWLVHKEFTAKLGRRTKEMGNLMSVPTGSTPLTDCIYGSWGRLAARPERRKIMVLVTDGQSNNQVTAKKAVDQMKKHGINVVGIGIGGNYIGAFCSRSVVVKNVGDLATSVMDDFGRMLLGERFVADNSKLGRTG